VTVKTFIILQNISISNQLLDPRKTAHKMYSSPYKRYLIKGSCKTEEWNNQVFLYYCNITVLLNCFCLNICSLG